MTKSEKRQKQRNKARRGMRVRGRSVLLLAEVSQRRSEKISTPELADPNEPGIPKKVRKHRQRMI